MNLLHICSYYIGNKLYSHLIRELSHNFDQEVFIPIKRLEQIGRNKLTSKSKGEINFRYAHILNRSDRLLFRRKIQKQTKWVENHIHSLKNINIIHAHTLFSDGGTAYELSQKYGINYLVTVRNTDINYFYKYAIHLRPFMYKILMNAKKIIFVSYAYEEKMKNLLPEGILRQVESRFQVIPNGIDSYWHNNYRNNKKLIINPNKINLLFIGRIDKNKNVETIISSCAELKKFGLDAHLHIVGSGPLEDKCKRKAQELNINVKFHGYISSKEKIAELMDLNDIFIMPSFTETFGLVYIEAMSRGLPVIYSTGQGIDGFFEEGKVGFAVNPTDTNQIVKSIIKIIKNYSILSQECLNESKKFKWNSIGEVYKKTYYSILEE